MIEAEIERIGVLRNPVISWQEAHGEPAPPRVPLVGLVPFATNPDAGFPPIGVGIGFHPPPPSIDTHHLRTCLCRMCADSVTTTR